MKRHLLRFRIWLLSFRMRLNKSTWDGSIDDLAELQETYDNLAGRRRQLITRLRELA